MAPQVSWIGLGNMGTGMAKNLINKANLPTPVLLHNRTVKTAEDLATTLGARARAVPSPADAIQPADIVFVILSTDAVVLDNMRAYLATPGGVAGKLFVDCSTIAPETTAALTDMCAGAGARFVAMPVFGAPAMAEAGTLLCVPAGEREDVDRVLPFTTGVMGRGNLDFGGKEPQEATRMKIVGNSMIAHMVMSLSEAHVLAEASGLGQEALHEFVDKQFGGAFAAYSKRMLEGDYYQRERPLFQVDLAKKDIGIARDLGKKGGAELKVAEVIDNYLDVVKEHMGERGDLPGIYGAVRQASGMKFENKE